MNIYKEIKEKLRKSPQKWLITGVAGFIGSNLANKLVKNGNHVIGIDNLSHGCLRNLS
ncbi:MAG: GDP-mannose 4,6-dehydratase, partial [Desulfobacterales bacterium]|nr:GDP-mannose 4,6-dehydratase [Desulfobacterales bacterium]